MLVFDRLTFMWSSFYKQHSVNTVCIKSVANYFFYVYCTVGDRDTTFYC